MPNRVSWCHDSRFVLLLHQCLFWLMFLDEHGFFSWGSKLTVTTCIMRRIFTEMLGLEAFSVAIPMPI
jgi:hypothetical protein